MDQCGRHSNTNALIEGLITFHLQINQLLVVGRDAVHRVTEKVSKRPRSGFATGYDFFRLTGCMLAKDLGAAVLSSA